MDAEVQTEVAEQVLKGLIIPPCPSVLVAALNEAKKPEANLGRIASHVEQDVGLSALMLKLASSPVFGFRARGGFNSVHKAITALGLEKAVNLIRNVALRQNVSPGVPGLEQFWDRSSLTASVASRMAGRIPGLSRDDAYMAALFHDCGIPVLMQKYPDYTATLTYLCKSGKTVCQAEEHAYSTTHATVGNLLGRNWFLPPHICKAILFHHDPTIFSSSSEFAGMDTRNLIGLIHMAECTVDEYQHRHSEEWGQFKGGVLSFFR